MNVTTNIRGIGKSVRQARGFSLVELLVTISILAILTAMTVPSITGLGSSGKFNSAVSGLSETLSLARQTAVARNTYVWVAFTVPAAATDHPFGTLVVASTDGTNPFSASWSVTDPIVVPNANFLVVAKQARYPQCQYIESGTLSTTQISTYPSPPGDTINGLGKGITFQASSSAGPVLYNRVIEFTPSGLVYNGPNPVSFVEFGVQSSPLTTASNTITSLNVACFRLPFITGRNQIYRP